MVIFDWYIWHVLMTFHHTGVSGTRGSGGGAGGSIWIEAGNFIGSGAVIANGGVGGASGGGGAGGRIAIYYNVSSFSGQIRALAGSGFEGGGRGTIYTENRTARTTRLRVDNLGMSYGKPAIVTDTVPSAYRFDTIELFGYGSVMFRDPGSLVFLPSICAPFIIFSSASSSLLLTCLQMITWQWDSPICLVMELLSCVQEDSWTQLQWLSCKPLDSVWLLLAHYSFLYLRLFRFHLLHLPFWSSLTSSFCREPRWVHKEPCQHKTFELSAALWNSMQLEEVQDLVLETSPSANAISTLNQDWGLLLILFLEEELCCTWTTSAFPLELQLLHLQEVMDLIWDLAKELTSSWVMHQVQVTVD